VAHALSDGIRRVVAAPVLLACVAALSLSSPLYPNTASRRILFEFVLVGSFLAGGILDRYARMRPTRAYGFFGACGRHLGAMLRLAAIEILLYVAIDNLLPWTGAAIGAVTVISLYMAYARVRLVVEDRRSAVGAFLAGARFVNGSVAPAAVFVVWLIPFVVALGYARGAAPIVLLPLYASAIALFQSKLAHAGYTAAPPLQWPESPAAETIANGR
jgi:hypothetical protein